MQIPRTVTPEVGLNGLPGAKASFVPVENTGAAQLQQFSNDLMRGSATFGELGLKMQDDINQAIVADALNQAMDLKDRLTHDKDEGYTTLQGRNALDRPDGQSLTDEYLGKFNKGLEAIRGSLKNQAQLDLFTKSAATLQNNLVQGTREHEMRQNTAYQNSVDNGSILSGQRMFFNAGSDEEKEQALNYMRNASLRMSARLGLSDQEAAAKERKDIGNAIVLSAKAKMDEHDFDSAQQILEAYADYVDIDDYQRLSAAISEYQAEADGALIGEGLANGVAVIGGNKGKLGFVSAQYEGKIDSANPDTTGNGDPAGWAYGKYQFNAKFGGVQRFLQDNPTIAAEFAGLTPGTDAFTKKWREYAKAHPREFEAAQDRTATNLWYRPAAAEYAKAGFNLKDRRIQEAVFSASIQHGGVNSKLLPIALKLAGGNPSRLSVEQQVNILYQARMQYQPGQKKRYQQELKTVLAMGGKTVKVGDSEAEALKVINGLPENQRRAALQGYQRIQAQKKAAYEETLASVVETIAQNNGDISKVPPSVMMSLKGKDKLKMREFALDVNNFKQREEFKGFEKEYYSMLDNPETLMEMSEAQLMAMGADIGYDKASNLIDARRKLIAHKEKQGNINTAEVKVNANVMKNIAKLYGLPELGKGDTKETHAYYRLSDNIRAYANELAAKLGRQPTESELYDLARKRVADKRILEKGFFGDTWIYADLMTPAQQKIYQERVK